jgi:hypothetical protein
VERGVGRIKTFYRPCLLGKSWFKKKVNERKKNKTTKARHGSHCNRSYSGAVDWEDQGSRPARTKASKTHVISAAQEALVKRNPV